MMNHEFEFLTRKPLHSSHMGVLKQTTQAAELCFACPKFMENWNFVFAIASGLES